MIWYYVVAYVFVVCCMVYWSLRAFRAEARLAEMMILSKALIDTTCKIVELRDENKEVNNDGE